MTWGELKAGIEAKGVLDSDLIDTIDVIPVNDDLQVVRHIEPEDEDGPGYVHIAVRT